MMKLKFKTFILVCALPLVSSASFQDGFLPTQDVVQNLYRKFGGNTLKSSFEDKCQILDSSMASHLGSHSPLNGEVVTSKPGFPFLTWHRDCIQQYLTRSQPYLIGLGEEKIPPVALEIYKVVWKKYLDDPQVRVNHRLQQLRTSQLSDEEIQKHVDHIVEWSLGSDDEILYYGKIYDLPAFKKGLAQDMRKSEYLEKATHELIINLLSRDEFLMY